MTVLDASALVAYFKNEPGAEAVANLLRDRPAPTISGANLDEVVDHLVRVDGRDAGDVNDAIDLLIAAGLDVEPYWLTHARRAALLRAEYYHRTKSPISLADAACIVTAGLLATSVATTDRAVARIARKSGIDVIAVPDSRGRLPDSGD
jgi:PIN domain nuclease of toxin-antitoxin system